MAASKFTQAVTTIHAALYGTQPAHSVFVTETNAAAMGVQAYANSKVMSVADGGLSNSALATTVLNYMGINNAALNDALVSYFATAPADRGFVIVQLGEILTAIADPANLQFANYGAAAQAWNSSQAAAYIYSSNPLNVVAAPSEELPPVVTLPLGLTTDSDSVLGTGADDVIIGRIGTVDGIEANTLNSGDVIDGGADVIVDMLKAQVMSGVAQGGNEIRPIQPAVKNVEVFKIEAQYDEIDAGGPVGDDTFIRAIEITDINQFWSNNSTGDLIVQDMTTLSAAGVVRNTNEMTIGMAYTGNSDSRWDESDYKVYFDQDYLIPRQLNDGSKLFIELMDMDSALTGGDPLLDNPFGEITFSMGAETKVLNFGAAANTYPELLTAIRAAITLAGATDPDFLTLSADNGPLFTATDTDNLPGGSTQGTTIVITNSGPEPLAAVTMRAVGNAPAGKDFHTGFSALPPGTEYVPVEINIALEKVGDSGDGGVLVIGSMNKGNHDDNIWGAADVNTYNDTTEGFEKFSVTVIGNSEKPSSLAELRSTNNTLQVVTVTSEVRTDNSYADLIIGNSNTVSTGLKDVQTFDASALKGDLTLVAALTDEVIAKYLNLVDPAPALPAVDNVAFVYTGGIGNDAMSVTIDAAVAGATNSNTGREDFTFLLDGGSGNDTLMLDIGDEETPAWYVDQKLNANVTIKGGDGNDTIHTPGAGDVIINAGAGDDVVYADNSGVIDANWIVSAANTNLADLQAVPANSAERFLYKGTVRVTFSGSQDALGGGLTFDDADDFNNGFESALISIPTKYVNYTVTQLEVNQAIKQAINTNALLNKLIVAEDGPGNTLVISSLIDGDFNPDDLIITVAGPTLTSLTATEQSSVLTAYKDFANNSVTTIAEAQAAQAASITTLNAVSGMDVNQVMVGAGTNSVASTDDTIDLGTGTDLAVLSTSAAANDTLVFEGYDLGKKTIVNFDDGSAVASARDFLDFTYYLTGMISNSGSAVSADPRDITINLDTSVEADSITVLNNQVFTAAETFAGLTAANLLAAINSSNTAGLLDYADITAPLLNAVNTYTVAGAPTTLVGGVGKAVVLIENSSNDGEYKAFELTFNGTSANTALDFTEAKLIATIDVGDTLGVGTTTFADFFTDAVGQTAVPNPGVAPTYAFTSAPAAVNEGATATFTVATNDLADGSYPYTLGGTVNAADITGGLSGTVAITNGTGTINVAVIADQTTEVAETLTVTFGTATSSVVTVNDTSLTPGDAGKTVLAIGTTTPVAATANVDVFSLDVVAALALATDITTGVNPNTQIELSGFAVAQDSLEFNLPTAVGNVTLNALNGTQGVAAQVDGIDNNTVISFGPDGSGDLVTLTLIGVTDLSLVNVSVI